MNKEFDFKHLNEKAQKVYQNIVNDKMHIGNPIELINMMFEKFESPDQITSENIRANYTHDLLLFIQKLRAIDQEFDLCIAARLAKIIIEQFDVRR
jgi:flagellin-specific chaperone FliS